MDRPSKQINDIITSIINSTNLSSVILSYNPSQSNHTLLHDDEILLILEGWIEFSHKESHIMLGGVKGPYILKLVPKALFDNYVVSANSHFSYISCPRPLFYSHIEAHNLWRDLFTILSYSSLLIFQQIEVLGMDSLYDVVKYYLIKIESDAEIMQKENICHYITTRTGYSRSGVMTIIRELRKGGYIETDNGRLLRINALPQGF
ncbi:helix-turn-helix domain-containing protein [Cronobacter turicensis]|uniref:helix-turn-helix domain-containing protein n=1 Tax=Cronobacter turicensis TaxID=413502 RepID=UPI0011AC2438|nr:helix-turn-helix domain-containing protein [Cronobacter turicensis]EKY3120761.1 helix-turn-helix domain-containing protein [Cronobacter turicensis]ELU8452881.1 helix-turn-helix domain-containing protein [Cronobacter turicensis]ELY4112549.1 helix-turn-helix domain-containing protein [Cronobacter turicensis]ELY4215760.1 helix-turn-helix domain-containing protein [Cronobacter turicensis]EMA1789801.1 helix-turn-helix domain-containing protein [Cronobacter turicensis]